MDEIDTMYVCCALMENEGMVTVSVWQVALIVREPRRLIYSSKGLPFTFQTGRFHCYDEISVKPATSNLMRNLWKNFNFTLQLVPPTANDKFGPTNDW